MLGLESKRVLITGACGAIAKQVVEQFVKFGAHVIGVDRHAEKLDAMRSKGLLLNFLSGDLTSIEFQNKVISTFASEVDVLINCVGASYSKSLENTSREDYLALWRLNFEVAAVLCQGIMPYMRKRRNGKVINVSTVLADHPLPNVSSYVASKAALIAFTKSVALEYAPYGVQANVISPGYISGPKHDQYFSTEPGKQFMQRFMPTGVCGTPDSVSGAFLFLASPFSDYLVGHVLKVDGGYSVW